MSYNPINNSSENSSALESKDKGKHTLNSNNELENYFIELVSCKQ